MQQNFKTGKHHTFFRSAGARLAANTIYVTHIKVMEHLHVKQMHEWFSKTVTLQICMGIELKFVKIYNFFWRGIDRYWIRILKCIFILYVSAIIQIDNVT